ncbi:hypothetical protein JDS76_27875 [Bacillus cereus]|uniref:Cytidyltransferase-like domain-containing protein n=1 Tax=Bacillus thuringiensis TaxID=1428 RepID=A0AAW4I594_BACTU|nr:MULTISPECIES: hypothetical protein [Bacillus cereus group]EOO05592.1 hypothetical protein IAW_05258 [Bacillus cereus str. Schrouff]EOO82091.1 hypothetical protein IGY_05351 [Bacillus cereus K-5975c]MBJ8090607.1 hypothetical protein [Bacillus cereus]MBN9901720.1 hypothetical protein [Bacillus thuringiensis]MCM3223889.1 hypothetical protein [Bacillus cereus]
MKKQAITFGRYNMLTNAHLSTVSEILTKWDKLTIGVYDFNIKRPLNLNEKWNEFYSMCDKNCQPESNDLSLESRIKMWEILVKERGLDGRLEIVPIKRVEYDVSNFNTKFPKEKYDLVFPKSPQERNSFDLLRNEAFKDILGREIHFVTPSLTLHTSQIKKQICLGDTWGNYLPREIYEYLVVKNIINKPLGE